MMNMTPYAVMHYRLLFLISAFCLTSCNTDARLESDVHIVYQSDRLIIEKINDRVWQHTSYLNTQDFGKVPCNGMIIQDHHEAIVLDATTDTLSSEELIHWIATTLECKVKAVIPTHFHNDNLGGLRAFEKHHIPSYAYAGTIALAEASHAAIPENGFDDAMVLEVGNEHVILKYFGPGHTSDNIIAYFPGEHTMFGGCLIKELNAGKGYLGDANLQEWSNTVRKISQAYPDVKTIIPGHGKAGNKQLLDYTIDLFKVE